MVKVNKKTLGAVVGAAFVVTATTGCATKVAAKHATAATTQMRHACKGNSCKGNTCAKVSPNRVKGAACKGATHRCKGRV